MGKTTFIRPEPSRGSDSFEDFEASKLTVIAQKTSVKEGVGPYTKVKTERSETRIVMGSELSAVQQEVGDKTAVLINSAGKIAAIGEECTINPKIKFRRAEQVLGVV